MKALIKKGYAGKFDVKNGKTLWEFKAMSGVIDVQNSYEVGGQYELAVKADG